MKRDSFQKAPAGCSKPLLQPESIDSEHYDAILDSDASDNTYAEQENFTENAKGCTSGDKDICSLEEEIALKNLSYNENHRLIEEYNAAVEADDLEQVNKVKWKIVVANMSLIRYMVKPIFDRYKCRDNGIEFDDLMCAGYDGIRRAIRTFDPDKGSLGTYAGWWIACYTTRYVQDTIRTMRLPNYLHDKIQQVRQAEDYFLSKGTVYPDSKEIADRLGWEEKEVIRVQKAIQSPTSIDAPKAEGSDGSGNLHHHFPDKSSGNPEKMVATESERQFIRSLLEEDLKKDGGLNKKERIILKLRFGIKSDKEKICLRIKNENSDASVKEMEVEYDGQFKTLEDIGKLFGATRERIRQIEMNALKKFRKIYYNKVLKNTHPSQVTTEELEIIKSIHHKKKPPLSFDSAKVFKALRNKQLG